MFLPASPTLLLRCARSLPPRQRSRRPCRGWPAPGQHLHRARKALILLAAIFSFFLTMTHTFAEFNSHGPAVSNQRKGSQGDPDPTGAGPAVGHWWDRCALPRGRPCTAEAGPLRPPPPQPRRRCWGAAHPALPPGAGRVPAGRQIPTGHLGMADGSVASHVRRRRRGREGKPWCTASLNQEPTCVSPCQASGRRLHWNR